MSENRIIATLTCMCGMDIELAPGVTTCQQCGRAYRWTRISSTPAHDDTEASDGSDGDGD